MRRINAFHEGNWYRGNTHAHTVASDGWVTADKLIERYRSLGYDFTAVTDHNCYGIYEAYSHDRFIVLPGVELDIDISGDEGFCHHVVGLGIPGKNRFSHGEIIDVSGCTGPQDLISLLLQNGNLCIYAHPSWSHLRHDALDSFDGFAALEVYNYMSELECLAGDGESYIDHLLRQGRRTWLIACDDSHQEFPDMGGGFIMVKARELSVSALIEGIQAGSFYASQGPEIHSFEVINDEAVITCSPCSSIAFLSDTSHGWVIHQTDAPLREAGYTLSGTEGYIRAVCTDEHKRKAWTQPIWLR